MRSVSPSIVGFGAELAQLGLQRGEAVGLLDAQGVQAADGRRALGEHGDDGERHRGVGHAGHVDVDAAQLLGACRR